MNYAPGRSPMRERGRSWTAHENAAAAGRNSPPQRRGPDRARQPGDSGRLTAYVTSNRGDGSVRRMPASRSGTGAFANDTSRQAYVMNPLVTSSSSHVNS